MFLFTQNLSLKQFKSVPISFYNRFQLTLERVFFNNAPNQFTIFQVRFLSKHVAPTSVSLLKMITINNFYIPVIQKHPEIIAQFTHQNKFCGNDDNGVYSSTRNHAGSRSAGRGLEPVDTGSGKTNFNADAITQK